MNKLKEDKLSVTMKGAIARNSAAENKMKANMNAMSYGNQKCLQSLEYCKNKYEKRQRELQNEKQRMLHHRRLSDETASRKISAPACMVSVVEYKDMSSSGEFITDLQRIGSARVRPRSSSFTNGGRLPSLARGNGGNSPEPFNAKNGVLTLPAIEPNGSSHGRQRRLSATSLSVPTMTSVTQARSAPSSPSAPRREFAGIPSPRLGRSKSPARRELRGIHSLLDNAREKQMQLLDFASAKMKENRLERQQPIDEAETEQNVKSSLASFEESQDNPKTRKISSPGTVLSPVSSPTPPLEHATNDDEESTLEKNFDQIRYCQYLRTPSLPEQDDERLPDELIPKTIIIGHTHWVPASGDY